MERIPITHPEDFRYCSEKIRSWNSELENLKTIGKTTTGHNWYEVMNIISYWSSLRDKAI